MVYESSYESGRQPFLPDTKRGQWLHPHDFIYAGMSLAFRIDILTMSLFFTMDSGIFAFIPVYLLSMVIYIVPLIVIQSFMGQFSSSGLISAFRLSPMFKVFAFIPVYLLSMVIYIVPLIVIQSFMGQFSSSGLISAFRLSPMFKGIGYVTLSLNICVLAYHSIFAMVPLLYMFASMQPTLPWSCEGFKKWAQNLTEADEYNLCNLKFYNESEYEYIVGENNETYVIHDFENHHIPSVLYFKTLFHDLDLFQYDDVEFSMSWELIICALLVWAIIALIAYKYFQTETIGMLIRYSVWTVLGLMAFFLLRFSFLPGATDVFHYVFELSWYDLARGIATIPIYSFSAFGPGWGLFVTLSSYNKFKTNLIKSSWIIAAGQFGIIIGLDLLMHFTEGYFNDMTDTNYYSQMEHIWVLYLSTGSVMVHMGWANLWSILYFFMMFLSTMILMITQLHSILTTIFDEFAHLREKKFEVAMSLVASMALASLYFTSNHGISYFAALAVDTCVTQTAINLLLILIVLWVYGRIRFQRDIEFMINQTFPTWSINILRFVAPLGMFFTLIGSFSLSRYEHMVSATLVDVIAIIFIVIPWLSIPGFAIYHMSRSMGTIKNRFLRCCRPTDWFPVEAEERQKYEQAMVNVDVTHTLSELKDEEDV